MIDVCIVSYNTRPLLERLLQNLSPSENPSFRVSISENGSADGTAQVLPEWAARYGVARFFLNSNIGYARGCNQLASLGEGDLIAFLNADVWLTPDDLVAIERSFRDMSEIAILGPKQRDEQGIVRHAGIFGTWSSPVARGWQDPDREDMLFREREKCLSVSGSAYFIRRSVWRELTECPDYRRLYPDARGAFLPTPHYFEETWCSFHAQMHGHQVFYDGTTSIGHTWHASHPYGSPVDALYGRSEAMFKAACAAHPERREF